MMKLRIDPPDSTRANEASQEHRTHSGMNPHNLHGHIKHIIRRTQARQTCLGTGPSGNGIAQAGDNDNRFRSVQAHGTKNRPVKLETRQSIKQSERIKPEVSDMHALEAMTPSRWLVVAHGEQRLHCEERIVHANGESTAAAPCAESHDSIHDSYDCACCDVYIHCGCTLVRWAHPSTALFRATHKI